MNGKLNARLSVKILMWTIITSICFILCKLIVTACIVCDFLFLRLLPTFIIIFRRDKEHSDAYGILPSIFRKLPHTREPFHLFSGTLLNYRLLPVMFIFTQFLVWTLAAIYFFQLVIEVGSYLFIYIYICCVCVCECINAICINVWMNTYGGLC